MDFSAALQEIKNGKLLTRSGWNGPGQWVELVTEYYITRPYGTTMLPFIAIKTAQGGFVPWVVSQTDLLATDWEIARDAV